eukprot:Gb_00717 [translate_table: standard]
MAEVMSGIVSFPCSRSSSVTCFGSHKQKTLRSSPKTVFFRSSSTFKPLYSFSSSQIQGNSVWSLWQPKTSHVSKQWRNRRPGKFSLQVSAAQTCIGRAFRWWEKGVHPNMKEVHSTQELIDSLLTAGDKLVVVDFYSPWCGACRSLHPKICQLAETNPDVEFVKVNYEDNKSMCYSLNIHVLPFFQFYRGAEGRVCSFSCTNATIKKFKDALAKHNTARCSLGPPKGLGERELLALSSNKSLSFSIPGQPAFAVGSERKAEDLAPVGHARKSEDSAPVGRGRNSEEPVLTAAGR